MKLLVVNNHSAHLEELLKSFDEVDVVDFQNLKDVSYDDYDALILSGGSSLSVVDHEKEYAKELELVRKSEKPILGICLGFELINFAFDEEISLLKDKEKGEMEIEVVSKGPLFESLPDRFDVYEAHRWVVLRNKILKSLAKSKDGIEAVKHPDKKIWGVQFHPEVFLDKDNAEVILKNFIKIAKK